MTVDLARLLAEATFEIVPTEDALQHARHLPAGTTVTVTSSPARGIEATVALCERLGGAGYRTVPHLAARAVADHAHLQRIAARLDAIGCEEAFVIGGDHATPAGSFGSAAELLGALDDIGHRFRRVGVAAYPEGHPRIDDVTLWSELVRKQRWATSCTTQLCLDPSTIRAWIAAARRRGVRLPVHVGVPGVVSPGRLLRIGLRIGVGDSVRFLRKHAAVVAGLARPAADLVAQLGDADGLHLFTFNEVAATLQWRDRLLDAATGAV